MPIRFHRKPHSLRRVDREHNSHWLDEGMDGQQLLFDELVPALYVLDQALCSEINRTYHLSERAAGKPIAILVPPGGAVGWQMGILSKYFEVNIWSAERGDEFVVAASRFNCSIFSGTVPDALRGAVSLVLVTDLYWQTEAEFMRTVGEVLPTLGEEGRALFCLPGVQLEERLLVRWNDGNLTDLEVFCGDGGSGESVSLSRFGSASILQISKLSDFDFFNTDYQNAFLKRHRSFFGKEARGFLTQRLIGLDYQQAIDERAEHSHVILLSWGN